MIKTSASFLFLVNFYALNCLPDHKTDPHVVMILISICFNIFPISI